MQQPRSLSVGGVSFIYESGCIRRIQVNGIEVVRMINAPVRDADWGTMMPTMLSADITRQGKKYSIAERFSLCDGALMATLDFAVSDDGVIEAQVQYTGAEDIETNRAGFTLLHPIANTAGEKLEITHSNGHHEETRFPELISPGQPAIDIVRMAYQVDGIDVEIQFDGEIFEMEDQRNWSDASYKTYCRPLSLPAPFAITKGEVLTQKITIRLNKQTTEKSTIGHTPMTAATGASKRKTQTVHLPKVCVAVEPDWLSTPLEPFFVPVVRFGPHAQWSDAKLAILAQTHRQIDVEIVVPDDTAPIDYCLGIHDQLARSGLTAAHIVALPQAYLNSYQQGGSWPLGATPADCAIAARKVFASARIGVGMLTHFTELNRCPPETSLGDYVTFGNTAIVHAADDMSVWETLEAMPDIFKSATHLAEGLPMRLGLWSIGMRTNPYGSALAPNPALEHMTMTGDDPRQHEPFSAAYGLAAFALAAQANVQAITLAAPAGRLGMASKDGTLNPFGKLMETLAKMGPVAELTIGNNQFTLTAESISISADIQGQGAIRYQRTGEHDG